MNTTEVVNNNVLENIKHAINQGNPHLELIVNDYLRSFIDSLLEYRIDWQEINTNSIEDVIYPSIEKINDKKEEFIQMVELIALSKTVCTGDIFVNFFEKLLQFYQDKDITLYTSNESHIVANDNYRYLNQALFISFTSVMLECQRFDVLSDVVSSRFLVTNPRRIGGIDDVNFIRFREYNYTLNEYMNKGNLSEMYSRTALTMKRLPSRLDFGKMIDADILLHYLSLLYPGDQFIDRVWFPETAAFNRKSQILPKLVSKKYFEKAKVLFNVNTIGEFKIKISNLSQTANQYNSYGVPSIIDGLCVNQVGNLA